MIDNIHRQCSNIMQIHKAKSAAAALLCGLIMGWRIINGTAIHPVFLFVLIVTIAAFLPVSLFLVASVSTQKFHDCASCCYFEGEDETVTCFSTTDNRNAIQHGYNPGHHNDHHRSVSIGCIGIAWLDRSPRFRQTIKNAFTRTIWLLRVKYQV